MISVRDSQGNPLKYINIRLSLGHDNSEHAYDDRFTDLAGHTAWPNPLASDEGYTLYVNVANILPEYGTAQQWVQDFSGEINFTLSNLQPIQPPEQPPSTNTYSCEWWRDKVFAIFHLHGYTTVGPENGAYLKATEPEIKKLHPSPTVGWQRKPGGDLRPRLFLDNTLADPYKKYADIGDWNTELKWEHCSDS